MIDKQKIYSYLTTIGNLSTEEIEKYSLIVDTEIKAVQDSLISEEYENDERIVKLVGAKANYNIALSKASENTVSTFTAGDISIKENNDYLKDLNQMVDLAFKDCIKIVKDDSFAFLGV